MKKILIIGFAVVAVGGVAYFLMKKKGAKALPENQDTEDRSSSGTVNTLKAQQVLDFKRPVFTDYNSPISLYKSPIATGAVATTTSIRPTIPFEKPLYIDDLREMR